MENNAVNIADQTPTGNHNNISYKFILASVLATVASTNTVIKEREGPPAATSIPLKNSSDSMPSTEVPNISTSMKLEENPSGIDTSMDIPIPPPILDGSSQIIVQENDPQAKNPYDQFDID